MNAAAVSVPRNGTNSATAVSVGAPAVNSAAVSTNTSADGASLITKIDQAAEGYRVVERLFSSRCVPTELCVSRGANVSNGQVNVNRRGGIVERKQDVLPEQRAAIRDGCHHPA